MTPMANRVGRWKHPRSFGNRCNHRIWWCLTIDVFPFLCFLPIYLPKKIGSPPHTKTKHQFNFPCNMFFFTMKHAFINRLFCLRNFHNKQFGQKPATWTIGSFRGPYRFWRSSFKGELAVCVSWPGEGGEVDGEWVGSSPSSMPTYGKWMLLQHTSTNKTKDIRRPCFFCVFFFFLGGGLGV